MRRCDRIGATSRAEIGFVRMASREKICSEYDAPATRTFNLARSLQVSETAAAANAGSSRKRRKYPRAAAHVRAPIGARALFAEADGFLVPFCGSIGL